MKRGIPIPRWGNLNNLAAVSGLSLKGLQLIRNKEPNVLIWRERGKLIEYDLAACNTNLRNRERQAALKAAEPKDFEEARTRKMAAEARLSELELARAERSQIPIEEAAQVFEAHLVQFRAQVVTLPQRWAPQLVGMRSIVEATTQLELAVADLFGALSGGLS